MSVETITRMMDPMMIISSRLMVGDSNTGCSSIKSVSSALEGMFSVLVWRAGMEIDFGTSESDLANELERLWMEFCMKDASIFLCLDVEVSGIED